MITALVLVGVAAALLIGARFAWPAGRRWLIRTPGVPDRLQDFAAATLAQGGTVRMLGYLALLPLIDLRLPRRIVTWLCRRVGAQQGIDFTEVELPLDAYPTLDAFFVRGLRAECRPICSEPDALVSPADATVVAQGVADPAAYIVAKRMPYRLSDLVPAPEAERFAGGEFAVLYLHPADCHRVFSPADATVRAAIAVPGRELPVAESVQALVPQVYLQNRRLVHLLETPAGLLGVVMIGAYKVGRLEARYDPGLTGAINAPTRMDYAPGPRLGRGDWLGTFHLGSTIVLVGAPGAARFARGLVGQRVRYGARIGSSAVPA